LPSTGKREEYFTDLQVVVAVLPENVSQEQQLLLRVSSSHRALASPVYGCGKGSTGAEWVVMGLGIQLDVV
jgi:hypothetical protein